VDLTVRVRMLTRTCIGCNDSREFPYVREEMADGRTPTWSEAVAARAAWWEDHRKHCKKLIRLTSA
jgi:hypothetical protein